ncbi:hypothetical protein HF086_006250 [Spodoptera exigua]|uniref:RRP15-like protein n=1 Tax=Spodoptera exigua TaxID=7107 RepID=A0A922MHD6_SPOEX|nr:hypothetical protein HF086_006250 [Spodoptera exigua]
MVVAETMNKPVLKVSMDSESDSSSADESEPSENNEMEDLNEEGEDGIEADSESEASDDENAEASDAKSEDAGSSQDASDEDEDDKGPLVTNEGWADSVAKILGSTKPKNKKTLVLSRAKKHSEIVKAVKEEKPAFEVIGDETEDKKPVELKKEAEVSEPPAKKVDRERILTKIATKGVVQLFNAVRNQQKTIEKEMDRNDLSEGKKEKILKKFDKRAFLDTLMGQSKSVIVDEEAKVAKSEVKDEDKPRWSALRDDFMMGAKMKDWDKESVDE